MRSAKTIGSVAMAFLLATIAIARSEALTPSSNWASTTSSNAGWIEVGTNSASGGGISDNDGPSGNPSIASAPDGTPYVAWTDNSSGVWQVYVRRWNGSSWVEVGSGSATGGGISKSSGTAGGPDIAIAPDGTPYVAWYDSSGSAYPYSIYVRRWNGSSWQEVGSGSASGRGISGSSGGADLPVIAIAPNGTPYVAWLWRGPSSREEIYVRRWNGSSWVEVGSGSASGGGISNSYCANFPAIAVDPDNTPYIAWANDDCVEWYEQIYIRRWNGSVWEEVGAGSAGGGGISNTNYGSLYPEVAIGLDGTPYVAWADQGIYVRRWSGSSWEEVGAGSASGGGIGSGIFLDIAITTDGKPYVTWETSDPHIYVKRWDGSNWRETGTGSASGGGISATSPSHYPVIAAAPDDHLYVAWQIMPDTEDSEIYIRQGPPTLGIAPTMLLFLAEASGADPRPQRASLTSSYTVITWTATVSPTVSWLSVSPVSGTTPSAITATASISGLSIGDYTTQVFVDGGEYTANNPQTIAVKLTVAEQIYNVHLPIIAKED